MKATNNQVYKLSKRLQVNLKEQSAEELRIFGMKLGATEQELNTFSKPFQMRALVSYKWAEAMTKAIESIK